MKIRALKDWEFLRRQAVKREQSHRDLELDTGRFAADRSHHKMMADHYTIKRIHIDREIRLLKGGS